MEDQSVGAVFHFADGYCVFVEPPVTNTKDEKGVSWTTLRMNIESNSAIKSYLINVLHENERVLESGIYLKKYPTASIMRNMNLSAHIKFEVGLNFDGSAPEEGSGYIEHIKKMEAEIKTLKGLIALLEEENSKMSYGQKAKDSEELDKLGRLIKMTAPIFMQPPKTPKTQD